MVDERESAYGKEKFMSGAFLLEVEVEREVLVLVRGACVCLHIIYVVCTYYLHISPVSRAPALFSYAAFVCDGGAQARL